MFGVLEIMLLCFCVGVTKLLLLVSHKYWKLINIKKKKKKLHTFTLSFFSSVVTPSWSKNSSRILCI